MAVDNYKPLNFYSSRAGNMTDGFSKFTEGNQHYFTYNKNGKVYFISQAYSSEDGRNNGIESVKKNMKQEARYFKDKTNSGKHYISLRAGNNQEIARSRYFENEGALTAAMTGLISGKWASKAASSSSNISPQKEHKKGSHKKAKKVVETRKTEKAVAGATAASAATSRSTSRTVEREVVESSGGGFKLWWLLPLLLIPLLWFLFKGCDGCNGAKAVATGAADKIEKTAVATKDVVSDAANTVADGAKDAAALAAEKAREAKAEADRIAAAAKEKADRERREAAEYAKRQNTYDRGNKSAGY